MGEMTGGHPMYHHCQCRSEKKVSYFPFDRLQKGGCLIFIICHWTDDKYDEPVVFFKGPNFHLYLRNFLGKF
jgi:hypothetical protein